MFCNVGDAMKYDNMLKKQQETIKNKITNTLKTINNMFYAGEKMSIRLIAKKAEVSTDFIYKHKELIDRIKHLKSLPPDAKNKERVEAIFNDNKKMINELNNISDIIIKNINKK